MTLPEHHAAPVVRRIDVRAWWTGFGRPPRIMGLDVARSLAVLGMMAAHMLSTPELSLLEPHTWGALVHGRSSILFAVLAGVSISLMTGRGETPGPERAAVLRVGLIARGGVVFLIGLMLELLGTPIAVILTVYGALYIAATAFIRWRTASLLIGSAVLALAGPPVLALMQVITLGTGGAGVDLVLFGTYPVTVWLALILGGMAIGRMRLDGVREKASLLTVGLVLAAVGYGVGALAGTAASEQGSPSSSVTDSSVDSSSDPGSVALPTGVDPEEIDFAGALCDDYGDGYISCYPEDDPSLEDDVGFEETSDTTAWADHFTQVAEQDPWRSAVGALTAVDPHSGGADEIVGSGGFAVMVIALCLLACGHCACC
ncbi:heparan-alpha-glucosaminide N-acetyltransferase domain-containing protein [Microbacterium sp. NPDC058342]|uniref:heparan-alpha-glucosaminide N-acetyltransferase domain-containing protein n=1 Tax=Microbacterium sp. NPDC058342 TaxID=3346454 RepID=UPI00364E3F71